MCLGVYMTIGKPAFCLFLYLTGGHFRGELQHGGDISQQKIKCRPIRTREIGDVSLSDVLHSSSYLDNWWLHQEEKEGKTEIQKIEYLEKEKSFLDEIKSIFHDYLGTIIWRKNEK